MKYEAEFEKFENELYLVNSIEASRQIPALLEFIFTVFDFIRHSSLPHPDFKTRQTYLLELLIQDADIIIGTRHLSDWEKSERFQDCYTSLVTDFREAKLEYILMQTG